MPGKRFEEFEVGSRFQHRSVTITAEGNRTFCDLTMNDQVLHRDAAAARAAGFKDILVNGLYTFAAAVGVSVADLTAGTLIANLGYEEVRHPAPVHPGDRIEVESEVVDKRPSSKPGRGIVTIATTAKNQDQVVVCSFRRVVLVQGAV